MNVARFLAVFITVLSWVSPAHAQGQVQNYNGIGNASSLTTIEDISFWYDVTLNTGLLLGEPIISTRFRWLINVPNSQATIPAMGIGEDTYESVALSALGSQAPSKVRIYNVKVEYQFSTSAGTLYHLADAGDPAMGDGRSWSFNVPDAPDWDRMFYRSALQDPSHSRSFVSAQTAKSAFTDSVRLVNARVLDAEISLYDLHNWYMRSTDAPEAIATEIALKKVRTGLFRNFGYSVRGVNAEFFPPSTALNAVRSGIGELPSMMSNYLKEAGPRLQKLMQMPKKLQNGAEPWIYEIAVVDARKTLEQTRERARNYTSPDKDPRSFRKGRPPLFGNPDEEKDLTPVSVRNLTSVAVKDHSTIDGDRLKLIVRNLDTGKLVLSVDNIPLGKDFKKFVPPGGFPPAVYSVRITALNEGAHGNNTGTLSVTGQIVEGNLRQEYDLKTNQSGTLRVTVLP